METKLLPRECTDSDEKCRKMNEENSGAPIHVIQITEGTLRNIVQETVGETMTRMGMSWTTPLEMQKDFNHLREWRETVEVIKRRSLTALFVTVFSGLVAACWVGIKSLAKQSGG